MFPVSRKPLLALVAGVFAAAFAHAAVPSAEPAASQPKRGANMPWTEYQAEDGKTNAQVLGPSRVKWDANHIEAEAIGRMAVRLNKTGDYVSIKTKKAANAIVVRYSIPDSAGGGASSRSIRSMT